MHGEPITTFAVVSVIAGCLGALALEGVMFLVTRAEWARTNMVTALGGLITRKRERAFRAGVWTHGVAAVVFASIYYIAMLNLGLARFPTAFFVGIGFGIIHGMLVSTVLVWVISENHPFEEYREAGFAVGVTHFAGHLAYGAVVGLVIAIASR